MDRVRQEKEVFSSREQAAAYNPSNLAVQQSLAEIFDTFETVVLEELMKQDWNAN